MSYLERDVRDLARLNDIVPFDKLLRLVGLRAAALLNVKNLGLDTGIDQRTANRYLGLLELTFQINRLPPWQASQRKRLVKSPKIYISDSGFACYLAGITQPVHLAAHPMVGGLFETWVWAELRKLLSFSPGIAASFYRTHQGREVDFVLERGVQCRGIEIKWANTVARKDFSGLLDFIAARGGGKDTLGVILYTGNAVVPFGNKLLAVPLRCIF